MNKYLTIKKMKKTLLMLLISVVMFRCAAHEKMTKTVINPIPAPQKAETVFYPMPPQKPRLQFLLSITSEEDLGKKTVNLSSFKQGDSPKKIAKAYDIFAVPGKIYISDVNHKIISIVDLEKKEFTYIKNFSRTSKYFAEPAGIWVTENDYKYVADFKRKQIVVFDNNNNFFRYYGEDGQFDKPVDIAVFKNKIYVCDMNKHMVIVIDKDSGKTIQEIGGIGKKEGLFYKPSHVIVDKQGYLYVNDSFNFRVQKFDLNGNFMKKFGFPGDTLGAFARPKGLDIDREGHLYVVDSAFENVQVFDDKTTDLLLFFGGFGVAPGSMYLPSGLHIDYYNVKYFKEYVDKNFSIKYLVYVSNMWGANKLNVYGFGEWIGSPLPKTGGGRDGG